MQKISTTLMHKPGLPLKLVLYNDPSHFRDENWTACKRMCKALSGTHYTHFGQMAFSENLLLSAAKVLLTHKDKNLTHILPPKRKHYSTCHISLVISLDCKQIQGRTVYELSPTIIKS